MTGEPVLYQPEMGGRKRGIACSGRTWEYESAGLPTGFGSVLRCWRDTIDKEEQLAGQVQSEVQQCSLIVVSWVSGLSGQCSGWTAVLNVSAAAPGALFSI